jgi:hypothetical protein
VSPSPPGGPARSRLQAAAHVTWQAEATREPCARVSIERGQGPQRGEAFGPSFGCEGVGGTGHGLRAHVTPRSDEAVLFSVKGIARGDSERPRCQGIPGPFAHSRVSRIPDSISNSVR